MSMIQCPNCKSMVDNSGAFCPNCGTPIAAAPEAPVQPVQAQPSQPVYVAAPVPEKRGAHGCSIVGVARRNVKKGLALTGLIINAVELLADFVVIAMIAAIINELF